jgi:hypothetical protein
MVYTAAKDIENDFKSTTATWDHKVKFNRDVTDTIRKIRLSVGTDDEVYRWIDKGTRKNYPITGHLKRSGRRGMLAFPSGKYSAKTTPGVIGSVGTSPRGGGTTIVRSVTHPGIKPRKFAWTISQKYRPILGRMTAYAIATAIFHSGHKP